MSICNKLYLKMIKFKPLCAICDHEMEPHQKVTIFKKGCNTLRSSSEQRDDGKWKLWKNYKQIEVHKSCRLNYNAKSNVAAAVKRKLSVDAELSRCLAKRYSLQVKPSKFQIESSTLQIEPSTSQIKSSTPQVKPSTSQASSSAIFNLSSCCLFCGKSYYLEIKKSKNKRRPFCRISKDSSIVERILKSCEGLTDEVSMMVVERVRSVDDLSAVRARYHKDCITKFFSIREYKAKEKSGPKFTKQFEEMFKMLENGVDRQWCLNDIVKSMGETPPVKNHVRSKLCARFGDQIICSSRESTGTIITFKSHADVILMEYFKKNKVDAIKNL